MQLNELHHLSKATQSALLFVKIIYFINNAGKLKAFRAEVDIGSFCTIVNRQYLRSHLPDMPVKALKELSCTYDHSPI